MRKFFYYYGIAAAILTMMTIACIGYVACASLILNNEGKAYSNTAMVAITQSWDARALVDRAAPELMKSTDAPHLRLLFDRFETLGPMVKALDCSGGTSANYNPAMATVITGYYTCAAVYQKHTAIVRIWLHKVDGRWMINGFRVESPTLAAPMVRKV